MNLLIRPEEPADRPAVRALITAAFKPADNDGGPVVESVLTDELREDPGWISSLTLVAELDRVIVGQVTCSYGIVEAVAGADAPMVGVGPVAVLPSHQGRGIGSDVMNRLIAVADAAGEPALVLLGSPAFYGRFGFVAASSLSIEPPDPSWGEYFQVRILTSFYSGLAGRYRYAAPFQKL